MKLDKFQLKDITQEDIANWYHACGLVECNPKNRVSPKRYVQWWSGNGYELWINPQGKPENIEKAILLLIDFSSNLNSKVTSSVLTILRELK